MRLLGSASLGAQAEANAFVGGFAEWMAVDYLTSDNHRFLRDLFDAALAVVDTETFLEELLTPSLAHQYPATRTVL